MWIVLGVLVAVVCCTLLVRWLLHGPPPPAPPWGTRTDMDDEPRRGGPDGDERR